MYKEYKEFDNVQRVSFNNVEIEIVNTIKYLGLRIDHGLTWADHISSVCQQLSSVIGILFKVKSFLQKLALTMIYNSLIQSKLLYMLPIYGSATKTLLDRIFVLQKRALKLINGLDLRHPTLDLFTVVAPLQLPVKSLYIRSIALLMYKILNELTIHNFTFPVMRAEPATRAATSGRLLTIRRSRTARYGDHCLRRMGPLIFNELPHHVSLSNNVVTFKNQTTSFLREPNRLARALNLDM